jgi:hypothetical protein
MPAQRMAISITIYKEVVKKDTDICTIKNKRISSSNVIKTTRGKPIERNHSSDFVNQVNINRYATTTIPSKKIDQ